MTQNKSVLLFLIAAMALLSPAVQAGKDTAYYLQHAKNLSQQAKALGPGKGNDKLTVINPEFGATGAAAKVAIEKPKDAADIMIDVGKSLIVFATTTRQKRPDENKKDPIKPFRDSYYAKANQALLGAMKYIQKLGKTNPQTASDMAIKVAQVYFNSVPAQDPYKQRYLARARLCLYSGKYSAKALARRIKDAQARKLQMGKIKAQRVAMNFH